MTRSMIGLVIGCAVVTWLPRIFPFLLVNYRSIPKKWLRYLSYLPISVIGALLLSSLAPMKGGSLPSIDVFGVIASIPTAYVAFRYKHLMATVLVGVLSILLMQLIWDFL